MEPNEKIDLLREFIIHIRKICSKDYLENIDFSNLDNKYKLEEDFEKLSEVLDRIIYEKE